MKMLVAAGYTLVALGISTAPAGGEVRHPAGGNQFDLACSGTSKNNKTGERQEERRYTLDLVAKRWCRTSECKEGLAIVSVTPDEIVLTKSGAGASIEHSHVISRVTGEYRETLFVDSISDLTTDRGSCHKEQFSGFPRAKF